jgi:hypothetical protein
MAYSKAKLKSNGDRASPFYNTDTKTKYVVKEQNKN